jgi:hypothetical protein
MSPTGRHDGGGTVRTTPVRLLRTSTEGEQHMTARRTARLAVRAATLAAVGMALLGVAGPASAGLHVATVAAKAGDSSDARTLGVIWA